MILGLCRPESLPDPIQDFLLEDEQFNRLEAYHELRLRSASGRLTPDHAYYLAYQTTDGTDQQRVQAALTAQVSVESAETKQE